MSTQDTANHVLVEFNAESQRDLLSNARTAPVAIALFHCNSGVDEVLLVFSLPQQIMETQQSGRLLERRRNGVRPCANHLDSLSYVGLNQKLVFHSYFPFNGVAMPLHLTLHMTYGSPRGDARERLVCRHVTSCRQAASVSVAATAYGPTRRRVSQP